MLIAKQENDTKEYKTIINIAEKKGIEIVYVKKGDKIIIDKNVFIDILHIGKDNQNLNNNSIIAKLVYNSFSMLFTGDCEKNQESEIIKQNINIKANVLKVAHHGSNTSSLQEFIKMVKPQVALIGVGKNNSFGHPNQETIERLKNFNVQIYRTDQMGEILIDVSKDGKISIDTHIKQ